MDEEYLIIIGLVLGTLFGFSLAVLFGFDNAQTAEFVCQTHGLELIDFEIKGNSFSEVECGKPKQQSEEYKVFKRTTVTRCFVERFLGKSEQV